METHNERIARLSNAVIALVADASRGMARSFDVNRVALLRLVVTEPGISPSEVARRLGLPPSSVTRHAQALEEAGHVVLRRNPQDGRGALIEPTTSGARELTVLNDVGVEVFSGVIADWNDQDIEQLTVLIERLTSAWARHGERQRRRRRRVSRWQNDISEE